MKISFEPVDNRRTEQTEYNRAAKKTQTGGASGRTAAFMHAYQADFYQGGNEIWKQNDHKGKGLQDICQEAQNTDAAVMQDYRTIMSHTMSPEDYAQMEEDGFQFEQLEPEEAVTILDKIKAELARSGQHVAGYTDDIDIDTLAAAVGSQALAQTIAESFAANDIPLTEENVEQCMQAVSMAQELKTPTDQQYCYMVDNGMDAEIRSFYVAQSSCAQTAKVPTEGSEQTTSPAGSQAADRYYVDDINGYYARVSGDTDIQGLQEEIDRIITQAGMEVSEENRQAAGWLLEQGLPLTGENLQCYEMLSEVKLPPDVRQAVNAAAAAMAEGREAYDGNLADSENIYKKAAKWMDYYNSLELTDSSSITARRQLEEIRLRMTAEVNVKLLESGFFIDTAPMEELIEALKVAEQQIAAKYFPQDTDSVGKYQQYNKTCQIMEELPGIPARLLGDWSSRISQGALEEFYQEGKQLQDAYRKAGESYEALMTAPRNDLGDSIRKAFANVDEILKDLGLDCVDYNQRAVRILGYNNMDITPENISRIREADSKVRNLIHKMTPAATLQMIRDGINPLEKSLEELNQYFDQLPEEYQETSESYSRFLYGLEQNHEISSEERSAYIGIYRLVHQVEKNDGAAIGAVLNMQAQLNWENLLSAARTSRVKHVNVKVSDQLGGLEKLMRKGVSITDQIAQGYGEAWKNVLNEISGSDQATEKLAKQNMEQLRQAAISDEECIALLQKGEVPVNADNLLAAQALLGEPGKLLAKWSEKLEKREEAAKLWEKLDEKETFCQEYDELVQETQEAVEEITMEAETSMDVRELQLLHKELHIAGAMARQEDYVIPMELTGEVTYVHLTLEQGQKNKGQVKISMDLDNLGHIEGQFRLKDGSVSGYFSGNTPQSVTKLERAADIFVRNVAKEWKTESIQVVQGTPKHSMEPSASGSTAAGEELYRLAKHFLTAMKETEK